MCISFMDWTDSYVRHGWARPISKTETLEILDQNEKNSHILLSTSMQKPQFVCFCCGCCCGGIKAISNVPRPVDNANAHHTFFLSAIRLAFPVHFLRIMRPESE